MNLEELERLQAENARPIIASANTLFAPYREMTVSTNLWYQLLTLLFSVVAPAALRSAEISRRYYDAKREEAGLPPHNIPLAELTFERFMKDMEPVRSSIQRSTTSPSQITTAALRVARSVENGGRWTIMKAGDTPDPGLEAYAKQGLEVTEISNADLRRERQRARGPNVVAGWARVATGRETCGWCWMLVSRGPVYRSAQSAGSKLSEQDSLHTTGAREFDTSQHMNAWHTGCDCKIVPVFDLDNWEGMDRHAAAERLWRDATRGYSGNDAINAYRRAVEAGEIQEYLRPQLAAA